MEKDATSFWAEIKKYEDTLARDPGSCCFAPLAELYRRIGLVDDAILTAQKGTELHPDYVGGHLALGRAFADKGMKIEARESLERVVRFTPENLLAQKALSQLYLEIGETALARAALEVLLNANPNDSESRIALESLNQIPVAEPVADDGPESADDSASDLWPCEIDEYLVELHSEYADEELAELEIVEELDEPLVDETLFQDTKGSFAASHNEIEYNEEDEGEAIPAVGIRTATIAELYVSQGHLDQAIEIYLELAAADPHNAGHTIRLNELLAMSEPSLLAEDQHPLPQLQLSDDVPVTPMKQFMVSNGENESVVNDEPVSGNQGILRLERWLENIRRVR